MFMRPIEDARPGVPPSQCYVIGMAGDGAHYKFSVPLVDYERAARAPRHFIETDDIRAPGGTIVDPTGQPFTAPGGA